MSFNPRKFSWRWKSLFIFQSEEVKHYKARMSFSEYTRVISAVISSSPRGAGNQIWGHVPTLLHHWNMHPPWGVCFKISLSGVCVWVQGGASKKPEVFTYQIPWNWSYRRFWASQHRCWELNLVFRKTRKQWSTCSSLQPMIYACMCFWLPHHQFLCSFYTKHTHRNCHWISFQTMLKFTFIFWLHSDKVLFWSLLKEDHI